MSLSGCSTRLGSSKKVPDAIPQLIAKFAKKVISHLFWMKIEAFLRQQALRIILRNPAYLKQVGTDKYLYITKVKDAWVVGMLIRF